MLAIFPDNAPDPLGVIRKFIFLASAYPGLAPLPIFIQSSSLDTIVAGLKCLHGRALVQYTGKDSLLEAETVIRSLGAEFHSL